MLARYLLVQLAAYAIDLGGFCALISLGIAGPLFANVFGKLAAGVFAFAAHRSFTFRVRGRTGTAYEAAKYFLVVAINAPASSLILAGFLLFIPHAVLAKILSDVASVGLSYTATRLFVFRRSDRRDAEAIAPVSHSGGVE